MPTIRDGVVDFTVAPQPPFMAIAQIRYLLDFTTAERELTEAYEKIRGFGTLWRDTYCLYGIDPGRPREILVCLNGSIITFLPWDHSLSVEIRRDFTFPRHSVNEDFFDDDEIVCEIEIVPRFDMERLSLKWWTNQVTLPGGFPF